MREDRDLVAEGAVEAREFLVNLGKIGRKFGGKDRADAGHGVSPTCIIVVWHYCRRCATGNTPNSLASSVSAFSPFIAANASAARATACRDNKTQPIMLHPTEPFGSKCVRICE